MVPQFAACTCTLPPLRRNQVSVFSPDELATLMIANGLVPYVVFVGTLIYEAKALGYLAKKKTSSAAIAPMELTSPNPMTPKSDKTEGKA